jgi:hypothetical protein
MKLVALLALAIVHLGAVDTLRMFGRNWTVYSAADWQIEGANGAESLRLAKGRVPLPGPRRPFQFALTDVPAYGVLTVEADVKPLGRSLMIVFAYRDEAHFDYAHLSIDTASQQPVHNGVFHVYGGERVRISNERGRAAFAGTGRWYHIKLMHDAQTGAVSVSVDSQPVPAIAAVDVSLGPGKVGIGSFDETAEFKNVKITTAGSAR